MALGVWATTYIIVVVSTPQKAISPTIPKTVVKITYVGLLFRLIIIVGRWHRTPVRIVALFAKITARFTSFVIVPPIVSTR